MSIFIGGKNEILLLMVSNEKLWIALISFYQPVILFPFIKGEAYILGLYGISFI